jgi:hypothetical protein
MRRHKTLLVLPLALSIWPPAVGAQQTTLWKSCPSADSPGPGQPAAIRTLGPCARTTTGYGSNSLPDMLSAVVMLNSLAELYILQGRPYQAEVLYRQWLARLERVMESETAGPRLAPANWLLGFKDGTIRMVTDYWLEDSILHYISRDDTKASAALSEVDLPFTRQLNWERRKEFVLPRPSNLR